MRDLKICLRACVRTGEAAIEAMAPAGKASAGVQWGSKRRHIGCDSKHHHSSTQPAAPFDLRPGEEGATHAKLVSFHAPLVISNRLPRSFRFTLGLENDNRKAAGGSIKAPESAAKVPLVPPDWCDHSSHLTGWLAAGADREVYHFPSYSRRRALALSVQLGLTSSWGDTC